MILKLTLGTGETHEIQFDNTSAITVTTVVNVDGVQTEKVQAYADIASVELVEGDVAPAAPEIVTLTPAEAVEAASKDQQVPISADPATQPPQVADTPVAEPTTPDVTDTTGDGNTGIADPSFLQKIEDKIGLGHDTVVEDTTAAVDTAAAGTADDPAAHITAALADVDVAIAAFPDSAQLADLKTQLEAIQADELAHGAGA